MGVEKMEMDDTDSTLMEKGKRPPAPKPPNKFEKLYQPCLAEIVGTMFFVFIGCVSVIENIPATGRLGPALVHGLAVAVMVAVWRHGADDGGALPGQPADWRSAGGRNGKGQLNLHVVIAFDKLFHVSQLMTPPDRYRNATGAAFDILKSDEHLYRALFGEVAMTCLVTMVVLLVAVNGKTKTPLAPFLVGCTVIINVLAGADVSGTCLNPARAFGPALMTNYWSYHWVYWVGPICGGVVAAVLLRVVLGDNKLRVVMKS